MSNAWDWKQVDDREYWMDPSDESYFYAEKWNRERRRRVLDLGCGLGRHSILFSERGFEVAAIDSSEDAVEHLRRISEERGLGIRCDVGDMHDLPYADGSFDCVFAYLSVSHTDSEGIIKIMSEIRRVLVPGGALFFTLCSKDTWSFTDAGYPRRDANTVVKTDGAEAGIPHFYVGQEDIERLLSGFRLVRVRHVDDCFFQGGWRNSKHYFIEAVKLQDRKGNDGTPGRCRRGDAKFRSVFGSRPCCNGSGPLPRSWRASRSSSWSSPAPPHGRGRRRSCR